jgi:hypothetical protein
VSVKFSDVVKKIEKEGESLLIRPLGDTNQLYMSLDYWFEMWTVAEIMASEWEFSPEKPPEPREFWIVVKLSTIKKEGGLRATVATMPVDAGPGEEVIHLREIVGSPTAQRNESRNEKPERSDSATV